MVLILVKIIVIFKKKGKLGNQEATTYLPPNFPYNNVESMSKSYQLIILLMDLTFS